MSHASQLAVLSLLLACRADEAVLSAGPPAHQAVPALAGASPRAATLPVIEPPWYPVYDRAVIAPQWLPAYERDVIRVPVEDGPTERTPPPQAAK